MRYTPSQLVFDALVLAFAAWTLLCHAVVALGGSARQLLWTAAGVCLSLGLGLFFAGRRLGARAAFGKLVEALADGGAFVVSSADSKADKRGRIVALGLVVALGVARCELTSPWAIWWASLGLSVAAAGFLLARPLDARVAAPCAQGRACRGHRVAERALWGLACLCALITLSLHRDNSDDAFYVNLAVAFVDFPDRTLFGYDALHGLSRLPPAMYHVVSFELLGGALSVLTGVPALLVMHLGLATLGGALIPLGLARLFRTLEPRRWLLLVFFTLSLYLFDGSSQFSFSMHGFARMQQGKAILWTVLLPAVMTYGIRFGLRPSILRFVLLAASQIAGVGLSSTGLWLMPAAAAVAVCIPLRLRWPSVRAAVLGVASSAYVIAVALWVRAALRAPGALQAAKAAITNATAPDLERIVWSLMHVLGRMPVPAWYLSMVALAWPLSKNRLTRRYLSACIVVSTAILLNPFFFEFLRKNLLGGSTFNRALWLLPIPAALALCAAALVPLRRRKRAVSLASGALGMAALVAFFSTVPLRTNIPSKHLRFPPGPKVQVTEFAVVQRITRELPAGSYVVAPRQISVVLPLVHGYLRPVIAKKIFFVGAERARRLALRDTIGHHTEQPIVGDRERWLIGELEAFDVVGLVMTRVSVRTPGLVKTVARAGYRQFASVGAYRLWKRNAGGRPGPGPGP